MCARKCVLSWRKAEDENESLGLKLEAVDKNPLPPSGDRWSLEGEWENIPTVINQNFGDTNDQKQR